MFKRAVLKLFSLIIDSMNKLMNSFVYSPQEKKNTEHFK